MTSTSRSQRPSGFGLLELVLGVSLTLLVVGASAPLWLSLERAAVRDTDHTILVMQARVALARLERDLRLATSVDCPFPTSGAVLEADPRRLVLLTRAEPEQTPRLVEWDLTGANLMRRWSECPPTLPASFPPALFTDNKTMVEGVDAASRFTYLVGGLEAAAPVATPRLVLVDAVALQLLLTRRLPGSARVGASAEVGR